MPETQNFDPVGFKRVHDNYRTFDEGAKIGSFFEYDVPLPEMRNTSIRWRSRATNRSAAQSIFGDKIADFD
jgi:hypothetical protein